MSPFCIHRVVLPQKLFSMYSLFVIMLLITMGYYRVGAALHNLGQFYLVQRKLEEARQCYEVVESLHLILMVINL